MGNFLYLVNVEAAIYKDDQWLIIKRSEKEAHAAGLLSLVGGKVEAKQAEANVLEQTLVREITEEVGIEVHDDIQYVQSSMFMTDQGEWVVDIVFLCRYKSGQARCMSPDEVSEIFWMSTDEVVHHDHAPVWLREGIVSAKKIIDINITN